MALVYLPRSLLLARGDDVCPDHDGRRPLTLRLDPTVFIDPRSLTGTAEVRGLDVPDIVLSEAHSSDCRSRSVATAYGTLVHGLKCVTDAATILNGSEYCVHLALPSSSEEWSGEGASETFNADALSLCCTVKQFRQARDLLLSKPSQVGIRPGDKTSGRWTEAWPTPSVAALLAPLLEHIPQEAVRPWVRTIDTNKRSQKPDRHIEIRRARPTPERARNKPVKDDVTGEFIRRCSPEMREELERLDQDAAETSEWTQAIAIAYSPIRGRMRRDRRHRTVEGIAASKTGTDSQVAGTKHQTASVTTSLSPSGSLPVPIREDFPISLVDMIPLPRSWLTMRRIFETWANPVGPAARIGGGRWNAGYQFRLSGDDRATLQIEGEPTAEVDYGNFQPRLALHLADIDPGSGDLYLEGARKLADDLLAVSRSDPFGKEPAREDIADFLRPVVKVSTMRFLFSPNPKDCVSLNRSDARALTEEKPWPRLESGRDGRTWVRLSHRPESKSSVAKVGRWVGRYLNDTVTARLSSTLAKHFLGLTKVPRSEDMALWAKLQLIESEIITRILRDCRSRSLPIVTVHDAVCCRQRDVEVIRTMMKRTYRSVSGVQFDPVLNVSPDN